MVSEGKTKYQDFCLSCRGSKVLNIVLPKLGIGFSDYKTEHCKLRSVTRTVVRGEFSTCGNALKQPEMPPDKLLSSPDLLIVL